MGSIIKASCKCGFESGEIMAGGGYARAQYYKTTCIAPAICLNCRKFLIKDYMKRHEKCPDCGKEVTFYNDPSVQAQVNDSKKTRDVFLWDIGGERGDFRMPNTKYLCPKCGKMTLTFVLIALWD